MSITTRPRGRNIVALHAWQAAFGTPAAAGFQPVSLYTTGMTESEPFEEDPILSAGGHNNRDPNDPAPGLKQGAGPLVVPACLNQLGIWLTGLFGPPATDEVEAVFTHVFTSGGEALPAATIEVMKAAGVFRRHIGVGINTARFQLAREAGFRRVELGTVFRNTSRHTATQAGSPSAALALNRVPSARGIVRIDDVAVGTANTLDATYDNRMAPLEHISDNALVAGFDLDQEAASTVSLGVRLTTSAHADLAGDGALHKVEVEYPGVIAGQKLLLTWAAVRFPPSDPTIEGPGGIELRLEGRAQQKPDAPMLTATLVNAVASYALPE